MLNSGFDHAIDLYIMLYIYSNVKYIDTHASLSLYIYIQIQTCIHIYIIYESISVTQRGLNIFNLDLQ